MQSDIDTRRPVALTGDRPTGPLHLGHLAGSLLGRVKLQDTHEQFILVADLQALTDNAETSAKVASAVPEVVADYLAAGIDPGRSTILLQSAIPELSELAMLFLNLVTVSRLERNPTIREEIRLRGFERDIPAGFLCYPASQAADILAFGAECVPVGDDQLPMIEVAREIAARINRLAGDTVVPMPQAMLSRVPRLPGIDGRAKASKSLGNAIFLGDDADTVREKVRMMFTDPEHLRVADPGKVEGNVVFAYLDAFDPDAAAVEDLRMRYRQGGLGDVAIKRRLTEVLEGIMAPMRDRRCSIRPSDAYAILADGSRRAREKAAAALARIRSVLGVPSLPS